MKQLISAIQYELLGKELAELEQIIPDLENQLDVAKHDGDLSENSEYTSTLQTISLKMKRKTQIESKLHNCEIAKADDSAVVSVGSLIEVYKINGNEREDLGLFMVDDGEFLSHFISPRSPLGGKIVGNPSGIYNVNTPEGYYIAFEVVKQPSSAVDTFKTILDKNNLEDIISSVFDI